jgi:hypothetical protein
MADCPFIDEPETRVMYLEAALREIRKPEGPFRTDRREHALECIQMMKAVAARALHGDWRPCGK